MNHYEELYNIKQNIEYEIKENKLFKLSTEDAVLSVIEKFGVLNSFLDTKGDYEQQEGIRRVCNISLTNIDTISFIQESLKWIFRWCSIFCESKSIINKKEIVADDIYNLMGNAYLYEKFHDMWEMNTRKKVIYNRVDRRLNFNYRNEETYKIHLFYDTVCRMIDDAKLKEMMNNSNIDKRNLTEVMSYAHQLDFNCSFSMEFDGFNLEDYRIFSSELTKLFAEKILSNYKYRVNIILPGDSGLLCLQKSEWIQTLVNRTKIKHKKIESIINFFTYKFSDKNSDVSLSYFVPISNNKLIVSEGIFNLSRPEANAMRLLAKKESSNFDFAQNNFEEEEREKIKDGINERYLIGYGIDKSKKNIPGMDLLVYDSEVNHLQVIELKYKIPVESTRDINNLDNMLEKAYKQVEEAKKYVNSKLESILSEYFGHEYDMIIPNKIDYFILTNYSIGTGINNNLPTHILLINHYIELMNNNNGMELVRILLNDKNKMMNFEERKEYIEFSLFGYEIIIPQYSFKLIK
ncbi:hypothetical protein [Inconstantimicrobium mannanitabidum]|uniref:Uncharacterized protein n=1 Tax=Inconstantimicrobium mannanitabidum TaxID=1604901 RepID=A0ACB5REZ7_9CLOT|nr:hypothetical protein [Clostridium sp. TW13]GKX67685.1 hypothetical protein rsdtw13_29430 [Clostridium sp. TW13]